MNHSNGIGGIVDPSLSEVAVNCIVVILQIVAKVSQSHIRELKALFCNGDAVKDIQVFGEGLVDELFTTDA